MNIHLENVSPFEYSTPCLVVPVFQKADLSGNIAELNDKLNGLVAEIIAEDGFSGKVGETFVLTTNGQIAAKRVILVGVGKPEKLTASSLRKSFAKAARRVRELKKDSFAVTIPAANNEVSEITSEILASTIIDGTILGLHRFDDFKTDEESKNLTVVQALTILSPDAEKDSMKSAVAVAQLSSEANLLARHWVNLPANKSSPQYLAEQAREIAHNNSMSCIVWDEDRILAEKMGALYAVGMGSDNPPRFIVIEYSPRGTEGDAPIVIVGKGMTFDTGGYSLKASENMEDMKDDMGGAAVVLATMSAVSQLKVPHRVIAIVASAENMINGRAQRPSDIVTARNGKTIEVLNTDSEGRLILADALSYASELKPRAIIDFATLTGAIGIALGTEAAGLFSNNDELANRVLASAEDVGERLCPFPQWEE